MGTEARQGSQDLPHSVVVPETLLLRPGLNVSDTPPFSELCHRHSKTTTGASAVGLRRIQGAGPPWLQSLHCKFCRPGDAWSPVFLLTLSLVLALVVTSS